MKAVAKFVCLILIFGCTHLIAEPATKTFHLAKLTSNKNPLLVVANQKGTVGVIPYYILDGKVYILLGQELTGGKREAAGTFSDFGGSMHPNGSTVLAHALREFHEETLGQLRLNEEYILKNGYLLHKKTDQGRDIYYIFVKFTDQQYNKTKKFNVAQIRLKASSPPNSHFEKETFVWVSLDDLLTQAITPTVANPANPATTALDQSNASTTIHAPEILPLPSYSDTPRFTVKTAQGTSISIMIRNYFLHDCLQNPQLPGLIKQLK